MFGLQSTTARRGLLTAAEEIELARAIDAARAADERIQAGEQEPGDRQLVRAGAEAKTRFIESNLRLVISIAAQFKVGSHVDRDDLIQDGMLGLDKAVERFDPDKGFRFSTYATWWIRQSIQRGLEVTGSSIRIPAHRASELRMLGDAEPELHSPLASAAAARYVDSLDRRRFNDEFYRSYRGLSEDRLAILGEALFEVVAADRGRALVDRKVGDRRRHRARRHQLQTRL